MPVGHWCQPSRAPRFTCVSIPTRLPRVTDQSLAPASLQDSLLSSLEWRCIGPHRGGRCVAVAGDVSDPMTFYFGACAGGVWKTTDGGTYWRNVSDGFFSTSAIGAVE